MAVKRERALKDLRRCEEALQQAAALLEESLFPDSISRTYYAAIHAAMLLLAEAGLGTYNPEEAEKLFTEGFAESQGLPGESWKLFAAVSRAKKAAAHDYLVRYSGDEAREVIQKARLFVDVVKRRFQL